MKATVNCLPAVVDWDADGADELEPHAARTRVAAAAKATTIARFLNPTHLLS
jgi:hypothetical protein